MITIVLLPFFNTGTTAICFYKDGKVLCAILRLKIYVNNGIKMSEQSLILKDGMPSNQHTWKV